MAEYGSDDKRWFVRPTQLPTLNFQQFEPHLYFAKGDRQYSNHGNIHYLEMTSHDPDNVEHNEPMGHIEWHPTSGEILSLHTEEPFRRLGVASTLFHEAKNIARDQGLSEPVHSADRSTMGNKWAKAVGGKLPKRLKKSDFPNLNK